MILSTMCISKAHCVADLNGLICHLLSNCDVENWFVDHCFWFNVLLAGNVVVHRQLFWLFTRAAYRSGEYFLFRWPNPFSFRVSPTRLQVIAYRVTRSLTKNEINHEEPLHIEVQTTQSVIPHCCLHSIVLYMMQSRSVDNIFGFLSWTSWGSGVTSGMSYEGPWGECEMRNVNDLL